MERVENLADILSGFAFKSSLFNDNGEGMPLIRIRDINANQSNTYFSGEYDKKYVIRKGDLIVGMDGEFNLARWKGPDSLLNQRVCKLTVDESKVDKNYFAFALPKKLKEIEDRTSFVTVKHLSVKKIKAIQIPLPPLPEQRHIAARLDAADRLRQLDRALLSRYEALGESLFLEMFGDPVLNEKGWEVRKLGEVGQLDRGKSKHRPRNAPELLGGPYPLIQTGDVANSGRYISNYTSTYSELGLKQSRLWPSGTLCITIAANIAKTGILTFDACFPDSVVGFTPDEAKVHTIYIQTWLSFLQSTLERKAPESAQKNINLKILRNLPVPVPPIEIQRQFVSSIEKVSQQLEITSTAVARSEALFQGMLQGVFGYSN